MRSIRHGLPAQGLRGINATFRRGGGNVVTMEFFDDYTKAYFDLKEGRRVLPTPTISYAVLPLSKLGAVPSRLGLVPEL